MNQVRVKLGFTIVELLIVVVVIAILVAVTIVAYNGISGRATDAAIQSELSTAAKKLNIYQIDNGFYPSSVNSAGVTPPSVVNTKYAGSGSVFCLTYSKDGKNFSVTQNTGVHSGVCQAGVVTTLAGSTLGFADGTGAAAQFHYPIGAAIDSFGTIYVADSGNYRIRKITPEGAVTTLAGSGVAGVANGTGTAAQFLFPSAITIDSAGTIYVADGANIRLITPAGVVTTLAGPGTSTTGFADGAGGAARFSYPYGIAVNSAGTVYIAECDNHRIRAITPSGVVTTLAGSNTVGAADGTGAAAQFSCPTGLAINSEGTIYTSDANNSNIRAITSAGVVTTLAGPISPSSGYIDGTGSVARFHDPEGIAVDSFGTIYVADSGNERIRKVTPAGKVTTLAGSGVPGSVDGTGTAAQFNFPMGIAVYVDGTMYVVDDSSGRIRKIQ